MATTVAPPEPAVEIVKRNPRTGEVMYTLHEPGDADLAAVMARARAAHAVLSRMSVAERVAETLKLKRYMLEHKFELTRQVMAENGKSATDALLGDIFTSVDLIDFYASRAEKMLGDETVHTPLMLMGKKSKIMYCPLGPVLVISPWNYPLNTALTPALCALLAGNAVILKPSEWTPMKGLLDTMIRGSGMLDNAMQAVFGGRETGRKLIALKPAKVFFTGSVRGGREILKQAAEQLIPVELELGGKDPMIVFDDANLERAANGFVWGAMTNTGQSCTSVERCFVQQGVYPKFVELVKAKCAKLRTTDTVGNAQDQGELDLGCITTPFQLDIVKRHIDEARAKGAEVWHAYPPVEGSSNYPPTIVTKATMDMLVHTEETFGPVSTIVPFSDEEDALRQANDSPYGLNSSVWSGDPAKADRVARRLEVGNVCINDVMVSEGNTALPFGGVKDSGIGRYKGRVGLHNFCNIKSVIADPGKKLSETNWFPYTPAKFKQFGLVMDAAYGGGGLAGFLKFVIAGLKLDGMAKKDRL